jgi:josephin
MAENTVSGKIMMVPNTGIYHERQRLALCAVHSVNNLLQKKKFVQKDFDQVCESLSPSFWRNPHRSCLRLGDFDVNVVSFLLDQEGVKVNWHDRRNQLKVTDIENLRGVLWNVPSTSIWGRLFGGRHWIALLCHKVAADDNNNYSQPSQEEQQWINLDSALTHPENVGTHKDCVDLLLRKEDSHILLVHT